MNLGFIFFSIFFCRIIKTDREREKNYFNVFSVFLANINTNIQIFLIQYYPFHEDNLFII